MRCPSLSDLPTPPSGKTGWPWTQESDQLPVATPDGAPWPRVSVVTPSYNQGQFIEETVRSVLLQGYPDIEYILMDGGSTDGTVDIIRRYEPWLTHWTSGPDEGQTHAINAGWARATGEILAYTNADDFYLARALGVVASAFQANRAAGLIYGNATVIDEDGLKLRTWSARPFDLATMLSVGSIVPQPASFYSRRALQSIGFLDERWDMIMDYDLSVRVGMRFPTVCLNETLAAFRDHAQSKSRTRYERLVRELIIFVSSLETDTMSMSSRRRLQRVAMSRIHYEWGFACLSQHRPQAAVRQVIQSARIYPPFVLRRPVQTAYLLKEALREGVTSVLTGATDA